MRQLGVFCFSTVLGMSLAGIVWGQAWAEEEIRTPGKTQAAISYYFDSRDFNTITLQTSTTGLPFGLTLWGFTDFNGTEDRGSRRFDPTRYFTEYRLSRALNPEWVGGIRGLGLQTEFNDSEGSGNALLRFGLTYQHPLPFLPEDKGWIQWRAFPVETNGDTREASVVYSYRFTDRLSLIGFADLNIDESVPDRWVTETELAYKLNDRFSAVLEYRYNGFEQADGLDGHGVAIGLKMEL